MVVRIFALVPLVGLFVAALAACSSAERSQCGQMCDCVGCSPAQFDNCLANYDAQLQQASFRGCDPLYDELLNCEEHTGFCHGANWSTSCGGERDRLNKCLK